MAFDLSQTDRLLTTARSVRKRLDLTRPVGDNIRAIASEYRKKMMKNTTNIGA